MKNIVNASITDKRVGAGEPVDNRYRKNYKLNIQFDEATGQVKVGIVPERARDPEMHMVIEVDRGVPQVNFACSENDERIVRVVGARNEIDVVPEARERMVFRGGAITVTS